MTTLQEHFLQLLEAREVRVAGPDGAWVTGRLSPSVVDSLADDLARLVEANKYLSTPDGFTDTEGNWHTADEITAAEVDLNTRVARLGAAGRNLSDLNHVGTQALLQLLLGPKRALEARWAKAKALSDTLDAVDRIDGQLRLVTPPMPPGAAPPWKGR